MDKYRAIICSIVRFSLRAADADVLDLHICAVCPHLKAAKIMNRLKYVSIRR